VDSTGRLTLKWPNVENTLTVKDQEIFAGPLKLRESGPLQIGFVKRPISYYYFTHYIIGT